MNTGNQVRALTDEDRLELRRADADYRCLRCGLVFSIFSDHEPGGERCREREIGRGDA